ncbi:EsaB/YukD family protein [uncultured Paludibaculum sp.]|uniref:arsenate reductase/protein-tyrosine-phosphatase family protein n=1 Tax=uncultured Paludibaculum sp. TaxID=1765020 RepID=UPI002AAA7D24|nr:EsaB/YukD family protein [uncultured Paludibaculum sp.]
MILFGQILMNSMANPVLLRYPNPRSNVFLMMRFRPTEHHSQIGQTIATVLAEYSLNLVRADECDYLPQLWDNVEACMNACGFGIAVFEQIDERDINPNVSLELGYMRGQGKKCLLLKERRLPALQTDLSGYLYSEFDAFHIQETIEHQVRRWLANIGIAKRPDERLLIFVSAGGTCRCAMAKAIAQHLLESNPPEYRLRVLSAAGYEPSLPGASPGARQAIRTLFGKDLLSDHRAVRLSPKLVAEADLILLMDHSLHGVLQKALSAQQASADWSKIHVLKPYFGLEGDVADPWVYRDSDDEATQYTQTAKELQSILESNLAEIVQTLKPAPMTRGRRGDGPDGEKGAAVDSEIGVSSPQTETITVTIEITCEGSRYTCELPLDIRVERLLPRLHEKLGLPTTLSDGRPLVGHLFSKTQDRRLDGTTTLRESGVRDREVLQIRYEMTAG